MTFYKGKNIQIRKLLFNQLNEGKVTIFHDTGIKPEKIAKHKLSISSSERLHTLFIHNVHKYRP